MRNILWVPSWYHHKLHKGISEYARKHNWHLHTETHLIQNIPSGWEGDGVICNQDGLPEYKKFIQSLNMPMVTIGRREKDMKPPIISDDDDAIAQLAVEYYMERGFKNYAVYSPNPLSPRLKIFADKLQKKYHINCNMLISENILTNWNKKIKCLAKKLSTIKLPLALFLEHDNDGGDVMCACRAAGLIIPEQVAILGVHNDSLICNSLAIPLSSVDNNLIGLGYEAASLLDRKLNGETLQDYTLVPPLGVFTRKSTDVLAVEHLDVAKAMQFIQNNYQSNIGISDIVAATSLSTRGLYKAFIKHLGHSPIKEVQRIRFENACKLLLETDMTIGKIATKSGFSDYLNFYISFRKRFEKSPSKYRQELNQHFS